MISHNNRLETNNICYNATTRGSETNNVCYYATTTGSKPTISATTQQQEVRKPTLCCTTQQQQVRKPTMCATKTSCAASMCYLNIKCIRDINHYDTTRSAIFTSHNSDNDENPALSNQQYYVLPRNNNRFGNQQSTKTSYAVGKTENQTPTCVT